VFAAGTRNFAYLATAGVRANAGDSIGVQLIPSGGTANAGDCLILVEATS
jgi:hypothetical protein